MLRCEYEQHADWDVEGTGNLGQRGQSRVTLVVLQHGEVRHRTTRPLSNIGLGYLAMSTAQPDCMANIHSQGLHKMSNANAPTLTVTPKRQHVEILPSVKPNSNLLGNGFQGTTPLQWSFCPERRLAPHSTACSSSQRSVRPPPAAERYQVDRHYIDAKGPGCDSRFPNVGKKPLVQSTCKLLILFALANTIFSFLRTFGAP